MRTRNFYSTLIIFLFLAGCDKPEGAPELKDPVYQDMKSEEAKVKKEIDAKVKELEGLQETYLELPDSDYQKKMTREDIYRTKSEISKLEQMMSYHSISAESRQIYARKQYLEYYKAGKGKEWPPAGVKEKYEAQKKVSFAPKQWSRGIASKKIPKKEEKKEGGGKH
ncbi:MAG: hypothetical protein V4596_04665 [Bdellovibrionota bacterium]